MEICSANQNELFKDIYEGIAALSGLHEKTQSKQIKGILWWNVYEYMINSPPPLSCFMSLSCLFV